jgi:hypothetical protein
LVVSDEKSLRRFVVRGLLVLSFASSCGDESHVFLLDLTVTGSPTAVAGRTIKAGKRDMQAFAVRNGIGSTFVELCTPSGQKFRDASIPLEVRSGSTLVSTATVRVTACSFAKPPGSREETNLYLEEDGTLLTDATAGDVRVVAFCSDLGGGPVCPQGDDF